MSRFDPDLMAKPGETAFQWARRTGQYSELKICMCCVSIEANGEGCHDDDCDTCKEGGLYEQAHAAKPGYQVTLGALADDCDHDGTSDEHSGQCERFGLTRWPCDLCGNSLHGDREAAVWWPVAIPTEYLYVN
jgi:hypothetical protein